MAWPRERGQAVVELALTIPLVVLLLLSVVQLGLVVRDQILVVHASREAARAGAVSADSDAVHRAAARSSGLNSKRMKVNIGSRGAAGSTLTVTIHYSSPTEVPLVGALLPDVGLRAVASMRVEM
ncbi:MAG: TadE/TadG family type IV pilus assembly protein [Acidimicrobiales bacterium]|nr:TadE/TadG family type IV pilus assembly protein [Acidimicrobiales bacterium]